MFNQKNVCKTFGCKNLGKVNSQDYTQFGNLTFCCACNNYFPLIDNDIYLSNDSPRLQIHADKRVCIQCGSHCLSRNGRTGIKTQRWLCKQCGKVFTFKGLTPKAFGRCKELDAALESGLSLFQVKQKTRLDNKQLGRVMMQLVNQCAADNASVMFEFKKRVVVATDNFLLTLENGCSLYVIVSSELTTGQVLAISCNYYNARVGGRHEYVGHQPELIIGDTLIERIKVKDEQIQKRPFFYDIDYGPSPALVKGGGCLIKPVYTSYWHFDVLRNQLSDLISELTLYIPYDCFHLGGSFTAFSDWLSEGCCHVAYVCEEGEKQVNFQRVSTYDNIGRWKDKWWIYEAPNYTLGVCPKSKSYAFSDFYNATLSPPRLFIDYLQQHPFYPQLLKMTPRFVSMLLIWFAYRFNSSLMMAADLKAEPRSEHRRNK